MIEVKFDREKYLKYASVFENGMFEADEELREFNEDAVDLAEELAITRYLLAKAEKDNEILRHNFEFTETRRVMEHIDTAARLSLMGLRSGSGTMSKSPELAKIAYRDAIAMFQESWRIEQKVKRGDHRKDAHEKQNTD